MAYSADRIADTIIDLSRKRGEAITNLKLQKLLYYAQAWHLVFTDQPLFLDRIEAWVHGPVVPTVFRRFRDCGWSPIDGSVEPESDKEVLNLLNSVLESYGGYSATELERLTHTETPWLAARAGLEPDVPSQNPIATASMTGFYSRSVDGR